MQQQVPQYPNTVALQQVPQDPNTVALQTVQTVHPKQQVVMLPTQSRQPAQQANSQSGSQLNPRLVHLATYTKHRILRSS